MEVTRSNFSPDCSFLTRLAFSMASLLGAASVGLGQQAESVVGGGMPRGLLSPSPGLHLGRFDFHGGISGTVAYDDFVESTAKGQESDVTWALSPAVSVETTGPNSRTLRLAYRPSFVFYTDHSDLNTVNHFGNFDVHWPLNRLTLSLLENVSVYSTVVRDIGNRATEAYSLTQVTADYELSNRTSLQGLVSYKPQNFGSQYVSSQEWTENAWMDYHFQPKVSLGGGVGFSQLDVEQGPDQTSESPMVRVTYEPSVRLNFAASFGLQFRQYTEGIDGTMEPIYSLSGSYTPREGTLLSLTGSRQEYASGLIAGQNYVDTTISAAISQQLPHRLVFSLAGGYTFSDYRATEANLQVQRSDNYYYIRSALNWNITKAWTSGLFFEHTINDSTAGGFNYDHNIVGLQAGWSF